MFGRRKKLMTQGATAQAVVIQARSTGGNVTSGGMVPLVYHLGLRVHFDDGSTADVTCKVGGQLHSSAFFFSEGDIVPVRYDPGDRAAVAVDESAMQAKRDADGKAASEVAIARAERRLAGLPDTDIPVNLPTDDELRAAQYTWRSAVMRSKQAKAARKQGEAAGVARRELLRLDQQRIKSAAAEKSAREKFDRLRKLRPDWTAPPTD